MECRIAALSSVPTRGEERKRIALDRAFPGRVVWRIPPKPFPLPSELAPTLTARVKDRSLVVEVGFGQTTNRKGASEIRSRPGGAVDLRSQADASTGGSVRSLFHSIIPCWGEEGKAPLRILRDCLFYPLPRPVRRWTESDLPILPSARDPPSLVAPLSHRIRPLVPLPLPLAPTHRLAHDLLGLLLGVRFRLFVLEQVLDERTFLDRRLR